MTEKLKTLVYPLFAILITCVIWEGFCRLAQVPEYLLPAPTQVATEVTGNITLLISHGWVTAYECFLGFLSSVVIGFPIALLIVYSKPIEKSVTPLLVFSQTFPKIAVAPLFVIWFGFGIIPKIIISFLIAFFPIVISTVTGLKAVEPDLEDLVRSMGASVYQKFVKIRIPNSLPYFFTGAKVAAAFSVVGATVGEFVAADEGLGYLILVANNNLETSLMFAAFLGLAVLGACIYFGVDYLEKICIAWHCSMREESAILTV